MAISRDDRLFLDMVIAISRQDIDAFREILTESPQRWTPDKILFMESEDSTFKITMMHKLVLSNFVEGLRFYLKSNWMNIPIWNAQYALQGAIRAGVKCRAALRVLLVAAVKKEPDFLTDREVYFYSMSSQVFDVAEEVVQAATFDVSSAISKSGLEMWHVPLHTAVTYHQQKIAEILLERGAPVDCLANCAISPMMVACHLVFPEMVKLLLKHGSYPSYPRDYQFKPEREVCIKTLTNGLGPDRGMIEAKSEQIVQLLLEAGMLQPWRSFLKHSTPHRYLSSAMIARLKNLRCELRSLESLAFVRLRNDIRKKCGGVRFYKTVHDLEIPDWVKDKLTFAGQ